MFHYNNIMLFCNIIYLKKKHFLFKIISNKFTFSFFNVFANLSSSAAKTILITTITTTKVTNYNKNKTKEK